MIRKIIKWYNAYKLQRRINKIRKSDPFIYD